MVVHNLAIRSHCEIGGDQAGGPCKLPLAAVDAPVDGPVLQAGVRAGSKIAVAHCAEPQRIPAAEMDGTRFEKAGFTRDRHHGLKTGATACHWLESPFEPRIAYRGRDPATV